MKGEELRLFFFIHLILYMFLWKIFLRKQGGPLGKIIDVICFYDMVFLNHHMDFIFRLRETPPLPSHVPIFRFSFVLVPIPFSSRHA